MENFGKKITDDLFQFEDLIISPLDNFLYSFNFATSKNINMLKDIQKDLIEEKQELNNKKDVYFNYIINQEDTNEKNKSKNIFLKLKKRKLLEEEEQRKREEEEKEKEKEKERIKKLKEEEELKYSFLSVSSLLKVEKEYFIAFSDNLPLISTSIFKFEYIFD